MNRKQESLQRTLDHIRYLSETIGGRGSCTPKERQAAEYALSQMRSMGIQETRLEPYLGSPSTYRPYALAFTFALLGTLAAWLIPDRGVLALAAILSLLGAGGMLSETDFANNWMRMLLPKASSQNAVGVIKPIGGIKRRVVLCAHFDTHRTPIFYSSPTWYALFGILVGGSFVSMGIEAGAYALGAFLGWTWVLWIGLITAIPELFAWLMCIQADFTPFSPGANDNASGVGVILEVARRLTHEPLTQTEVWLAFTGCEETGAHGMAAFLEAHAAELGEDAIFIILDEVGYGRINYLTADGLIVKRKTHPQALELASSAAATLPDLEIVEQVGIAYTDAAVATKRGLIALSVNALPLPGAPDAIHWHQMSDVAEYIDPQTLQDIHTYTWQLLQILDE